MLICQTVNLYLKYCCLLLRSQKSIMLSLILFSGRESLEESFSDKFYVKWVEAFLANSGLEAEEVVYLWWITSFSIRMIKTYAFHPNYYRHSHMGLVLCCIKDLGLIKCFPLAG